MNDTMGRRRYIFSTPLNQRQGCAHSKVSAKIGSRRKKNDNPAKTAAGSNKVVRRLPFDPTLVGKTQQKDKHIDGVNDVLVNGPTCVVRRL